MLRQVWAAIDEGRNGEARSLLEADPALLTSTDGQMALGYALAHEGLFDEAREVYARLRAAHVDRPKEHILSTSRAWWSGWRGTIGPPSTSSTRSAP